MAGRRNDVSGGRPSLWPVLALVVVAMAGLAVVVTTAGPAQFGQPRVSALLGLEPPVADVPAREPVPEEIDTEPAEQALPGWMAVVWLMGLCALAALAVRWVTTLLQGDDAAPSRDPDEPFHESAGEARMLESVRRAVREAAEALDRTAPDGDERDAVIACWVALEAAAVRAGATRVPAQTPTEFTRSLLEGQDADPDATAELLALYHRARFSGYPDAAGGTDAVTRARRALERIDASLAGAAGAYPPGTSRG